MENYNKRRIIRNYNSFMLASSNAYVLNALGKSLYRMEHKLNYIGSIGADIDNVIIILFRNSWFKKNNTGHLTRKHY